MASNSFGTLFRITTWGESHGKAMGVVIDGCPAGLEISEQEINTALARRAPGRNACTSSRREGDQAEIMSGIFEGKTTGAPICIIIPNQDSDSSKYTSIQHLYRPGHANFTYLEKYGIFDYRGGGRASARETVGRVAAGAIAKKWLDQLNVRIVAYLKQVGDLKANVEGKQFEEIRQNVEMDSLFCPDTEIAQKMATLIEITKNEGDSCGGLVEFLVQGIPVGLGDPIYEKLESKLAQAMMSLPATKGFEMGSGFECVAMQGSEHNDSFAFSNDRINMQTNHAGGTLGGISTGKDLVGRVAFKPTASIMKAQNTVDIAGNVATFQLPEGSRHDPCVAIRAVPIVEAMIALVLVDALLLNRCARL